MGSDPTTRFTSRVADYVRFRPDYPHEIFALLTREAALRDASKIADLGSGTGISAKRLLQTGATVLAVEPNAAMRAAAEEALGGEANFRSIDGTSEATTLPSHSVDLVTAFQAFHWFDRVASRREFVRILKPGGLVALVWNERVEEGTPFLRGYEALLREFAGDYFATRHRAISQDDLATWFGGRMRTASFRNAQRFDFEGTLGRLMSSSYAPLEGDSHHAPMVTALRRLFDETAVDDRIEFLYETNVYFGPLG